MAYADFNYYQNTFQGVVIPADAFPRVSQRASEYIMYKTRGESTAKLAEFETQIKDATCAVAEEMYVKPDESEHIVSETVGPHSVTYDRKASTGMKAHRDKRMEMYLANTGLLWSGVRG